MNPNYKAAAISAYISKAMRSMEEQKRKEEQRKKELQQQKEDKKKGNYPVF